MDNDGWGSCVPFKCPQSHVRAVPFAQPPRFPYLPRPLSVTHPEDCLAHTRKQTRHMAAKESIRSGDQNVPLHIQPKAIDLQWESLESLSPDCLRQLTME